MGEHRDPKFAVYRQSEDGSFTFVRWAHELTPYGAVRGSRHLTAGLWMVQRFNRGASGQSDQAFLIKVEPINQFEISMVGPE